MEQEKYQAILNYLNSKSYNQNVSENEKRKTGGFELGIKSS
jgi:hypothetical protein